MIPPRLIEATAQGAYKAHCGDAALTEEEWGQNKRPGPSAARAHWRSVGVAALSASPELAALIEAAMEYSRLNERALWSRGAIPEYKNAKIALLNAALAFARANSEAGE